MLYLPIASLQEEKKGEREKNDCVCSSDRFIGRRAVSCCGTSYPTLNELSECLPQQVNKSVIPHCGHGCRVNVESIRWRAKGDGDSGEDEVTDELKLKRQICLCISVCFNSTLSRREETRRWGLTSAPICVHNAKLILSVWLIMSMKATH